MSIFRRVLSVSAALFFAIAGAANAASFVTKTGKCEYTFLVKIAIYGHNANADRAQQMENDFQKLWNGPSGDDALVLGSNVGITPRELLDTDQGPEALNDDREKIDAEWNKYLEEFGLDGSCSFQDCCVIKFRAEVISIPSEDDVPEGYHWVEIVPDTKTETAMRNGREVQVPFRSYVYKIPVYDNFLSTEPSHFRRSETSDDNTSGMWIEAKTRGSADAHEIGHFMGLGDTYIEGGGDQPGHSHDIMADTNGFPFESAFDELKDTWGMDCDECCPKESGEEAWINFGEVVGVIGDAIQACNTQQIQNLLDRLRGQRREVALIDMPVRQKIRLASSLDNRIAAAEAALKDCPPDRPVTGSIGSDPDLTLGGLLPAIQYATESTTWCNFGEGIPLTTDDGDDPRDAPPPEDGGDDPRDTPPPPEDGGDDPRDTPPPPVDGGDDPRDAPPPPGEDDGDDPRDLPGPKITIPVGDDDDEDDGDDPRDTPDEDTPEDDDDDDPRDVPVGVKARAAVLDGTSSAVKDQAPFAGLNVKFFDPVVADLDLPSPGAEKVDVAYDKEPLQCTTDEDGNCVIDVPPCEQSDPSKCPLGLAPSDVSKTGYNFEIEVAATVGMILKVDDAAMKAGGAADYENEIEEIEELVVTGTRKSDDAVVVGGKKYYTYSDYGLSYGDYDLGNDWKMRLAATWNIEGAWALSENVCRDKKPGPPLGWIPVDYEEGDAIPSKTLTLEMAP